MNTKRIIIGEIETIALNAIVHQPDEKAAAEKHFSETAKKIVEKALQAVDIMEIGDVCRRAVTGASIQDYDLLAKLLTDKDFDHDRLAKAIEALASERPIDYPTFYTPGWLCELAKKMEAGRAVSTKPPTDDELHEAATEEPADKVKVEGEGEQRKSTSTVHLKPSPIFHTLPSGADGTPPGGGKAPHYLDFCRMHMQVFGGKGKATKFIGKRTNKDAKNPVQIFEIEVKRPNGPYGSVATATENGELLFRLETHVNFGHSKRMAVKCLRALLCSKAKDNDKRHRQIKRKRAAAKAGEVA